MITIRPWWGYATASLSSHIYGLLMICCLMIQISQLHISISAKKTPQMKEI